MSSTLLDAKPEARKNADGSPRFQAVGSDHQDTNLDHGEKGNWGADTRITHNNFGYHGLEPELEFRFFGFGLQVSGNLPTHTEEGRLNTASKL